MEENCTLHITHVEKMKAGIIVTFEDGRCAIYSAALLLATFPQADEVQDVGWDD
jgi:hypothetical protein